jgi:hypothetical protein
MLDSLLSRFVIVKVEKYSFEEFKQVVIKVLDSLPFQLLSSFLFTLSIITVIYYLKVKRKVYYLFLFGLPAMFPGMSASNQPIRSSIW